MDDAPTPHRATFHYLKSADFRTLHVDGAIGSKTPSGQIHCAIFSERPAIPRVVSHELDVNGELIDGGEHIIDGRSGYVRELQADLVLTTEVALSIIEFLTKLVNQPVGESEMEEMRT